MKKHLPLIITFVLMACLLLVPGMAFGDVGNFSGGSNYGGGSSSSGGSSFGGSSSSGAYVGSSSGVSGDEGPLDFIAIILALIIIIIVFFVKNKRGGGGGGTSGSGGTGGQPAGAQRTSDADLQPFDSLKERDPEFNKADIEQRVANLYVKMQNAWTAKDFEPMRPYFDNQLYGQLERQLKDLAGKGLTNYVDNIAVLESTARGWYEAGGNECLIMKIRTRINDYTVDDNTGQVVMGSRDHETFMEYEYTLVRPVGTKTSKQGADVDSKHCPNCGAPLDEAASAKCPYCDSVITFDEHDWVISNMKGISKQTV